MANSTDREKLQALLDGKILESSRGCTFIDAFIGGLVYTGIPALLVLRQKMTNVVGGIHASVGASDLRDQTIHEEPKWYENIPEQGVLCRVYDKSTQDAVIKIVIEYKATNSPYCYKTIDDDYYSYAEPVQLVDLEPYILKG